MIKWIRNIFSSFEEYYCDYEDFYRLEKEVQDLKSKYNRLLEDVKRLEVESVEQTNALYEVSNSLDARIDIIYNELKGMNGDGI